MNTPTNFDLVAAEEIIRSALQEFEQRTNLSNAEIRPGNTNADVDFLVFTLSWSMPISGRQNRRSRPIKLRLPRERIDDDGFLAALENGMPGFRTFLRSFDPNHNFLLEDIVDPEIYIISY